MDLSEMSLINKMLQDLEGRRLEGDVVGAMHCQVRATPETKKIHVAWWIVLGLTLVLTGVISWFWGYKTSSAVVSAAQAPQLALKLAPSIQIPQPSAPQSQVVEEKSDSVPVAAAEATPAASEGGFDQVSNAAFAVQAKKDAASIPVAPASMQVSAKTANPVTVSTPPTVATHTVAAEKSLPVLAAMGKPSNEVLAKSGAVHHPAPKSEKTTEFDIPPNVSKQIKEPTPQQRAEEEYGRATVLLDQGKTSESMAALERALQFDPQHSVARQTLAGLLLEAKRQDDAIRKLRDGLALDKSHPALAMMLARLQVDKGELRPAVETLQRTLSYAADRADYHAFLAALLQREGRHKEAAEHYQTALRKFPQNGLWWMGIAISLQADNRLAEARDAFGRAKASNTLSPELLAFVDQKLSQLH